MPGLGARIVASRRAPADDYSPGPLPLVSLSPGGPQLLAPTSSGDPARPAGATERMRLSQGTAEALNAVHGFTAEKIREMPPKCGQDRTILEAQTTINPDPIE